MGVHDKYLFPILEAGSSRVFNICARTAQICQLADEGGEEAAPELMFSTRELNRMILVKEARTDRGNPHHHVTKPVGTKIYLPYNPERIYEGGKSAFLDDPKIENILQDHIGLDVSKRNKKIIRNLNIIRVLDEIPSLDPFLVKDKMNIEGIIVNEAYFQISDKEWHAIQMHIAVKLKSVIDFAFQDSEEVKRGRTIALINKLWNTSDAGALAPIIKAFNIPTADGPAVFGAWKGIMYYDYEYSRCQERWKEALQWLERDTTPVDFVDQERKEHLGDLIGSVRTQFDAGWRELREIFSSYEAAYNTLFVDRKDAQPFVHFMRGAVKCYWALGTKMSAINHVVSVWDALTKASFKRRLKYEKLFQLLELQRDIFDKS